MGDSPLAAALAALDLPGWGLPLAVFALRAVDLTLSTLRMMAVLRGRAGLAWLLGFAGAFLFVTAVAGVVTRLDGWSLLGYAGGYATGTLIGQAIEARAAPGRSLLRVQTPGSARAVTEALHAAGIGATCIPGRDPATGERVLCYVPRREVEPLRRLIETVEPQAVLTAQNVRSLRGGWHV